MKKKTISLFLVMVLCVTLAGAISGCGEKAYDYDLSKYVTLGEYKGLEMEKIKVSVSDKEVQDEITTRLEAKQTKENVKTGTVKDGDTINIAYEGKIDGKTFEGGSTESSDITIGTTSMIDGFTEGLIGAKVGDTVSLDLKFPENYEANTSLSGKDVVFKVTINTKQITKTPELNMDFVKANSKATTMEAYKKSVKDDVYKKKYEDAQYAQKNALWDKVTASSKILKYPDVEIKKAEKDTKKQYEDMAAKYKLEYADFIKQYMQMSEEEFNKQIEQYAQSMVGQEMIMYAVAREENIEVSDKEYDEYLENMLKESGFTDKTFEESFGKPIEEYAKDKGFRTGKLLEKVLNMIEENAVVK